MGCSVFRIAQGLVLALVFSLATSSLADESAGQLQGSNSAPIKLARSSKSNKLAPPTTPQAGNRSAAQHSLPANPTKPEVALSDAHKKTCLKLVGDRIDSIQVRDFTGKEHRFQQLLSDKLTVVVFWNQKSLLAIEQFRRIPLEILATFASHRVKVIAVNVGGTAAATRVQTGDAADKIVSLVDTDAKFFRQLATSRIPRTYVLDQEGRILWFDIEYSSNTVRSLSNALVYHLTPNL